MNRRYFLKTAAASAATAFSLVGGCYNEKSLSKKSKSHNRPNFILCMSDDQGWGDTGYNGHPHLKTPNLDRMAGEGITFTRFYSAAAMCSPTRGSVYTGRNPYRYGIKFAMEGKLEEKEVLITSTLKDAGYTTGHFGKWHMGTLSKDEEDQKRWGEFKKHPVRYYCPPWECDVDVSFVTESKVPTWDPLLEPSDKTKPYGNDYFTGPGQTVTENTIGDDSRVIMDRAIPFIQNAVEEEKPFLAVIWFHAPHSPVIGGAKYREMYSDHPEPNQHYYGCLTALDDQMGRLRKELKRLGVEDNTMLWFCSDNGPARQGSPRHVGSNGGLRGYKLSIEEGGIRVPGLLVWPAGVYKPRTVTAPCVTSDYLPTILDAAGLPLPDDRIYDGISLMPLLKGERTKRECPIGFLNEEGTQAVWMDDQYKLIVDDKRKRSQLYDIPVDPSEENNLIDQKPEVVSLMKTELTEWKNGVMKDLEIVNNSYNDYSK